MLVRTGVDLVDIERVRRLADTGGQAFLDQTWTREEQRYCAGRPDRLATRWGAKEAVMKALGSGFPDIEHLEIEVVSAVGRAPQLVLTGGAAQQASDLGLTEWALSLSHEMGLAMASVVAAGGSS